MHMTDLLKHYESTYPDVRFNFDIRKGVRIYGFPYDLVKTMEILLSNAVEAVAENKNECCVDLYARETEAHVILSVSDNGKGIPRQHRSKVFEPFFTTKEDPRSGGLSLYVAYNAVDKMQGKIMVEENPIGGAMFTIRFPKSEKMLKDLYKKHLDLFTNEQSTVFMESVPDSRSKSALTKMN